MWYATQINHGATIYLKHRIYKKKNNGMSKKKIILEQKKTRNHNESR